MGCDRTAEQIYASPYCWEKMLCWQNVEWAIEIAFWAVCRVTCYGGRLLRKEWRQFGYFYRTDWLKIRRCEIVRSGGDVYSSTKCMSSTAEPARCGAGGADRGLLHTVYESDIFYVRGRRLEKVRWTYPCTIRCIHMKSWGSTTGRQAQTLEWSDRWVWLHPKLLSIVHGKRQQLGQENIANSGYVTMFTLPQWVSFV